MAAFFPRAALALGVAATAVLTSGPPARAASGVGGHIVILRTAAASNRKSQPLTEIAVAPASGGAVRVVGTAGAYLGVAAQRNSGLLALGGPNGLYLQKISGGKAQRVVPVGAPTQISHPAWAPDDKRLVFLAAPAPGKKAVVVEPSLWIVDRNGHNAQRVLDASHTADLLTVAWSPDGSSLLLSRFNRGQGSISVLALASKKEYVLAHGFDAAYAPNGHRIAYTLRGAPGHSQIWIVDAKTGRGGPLKASGLTQMAVPVWSPDGSHLAFLGSTSRTATFIQPYGLYTATISGADLHRVVTDAAPLLAVGQETLAWTSQ